MRELLLKLREEIADFTLVGLDFVEKAFTMNSLRFLLVHRSPAQSEQIAAVLARANHSVLPAAGLAEAADALTVERFDAVLLASEFHARELREFSAHLRRMEQAQRAAVHMPVIGLAHIHAHEIAQENDTEGSGIDALIPEPIDPSALTDTVIKLAQAVSSSSSGKNGAADEELGVLDPEKFKEQVGFDTELMVEIIDLFLDERQKQEPEMREALMSGKFELLCRLAHTIKGSLSSLHAMRARSHAQELEFAAKKGDEDVCWQSLAALEADLAELEPELLALRAS